MERNFTPFRIQIVLASVVAQALRGSHVPTERPAFPHTTSGAWHCEPWYNFLCISVKGDSIDIPINVSSVIPFVTLFQPVIISGCIFMEVQLRRENDVADISKREFFRGSFIQQFLGIIYFSVMLGVISRPIFLRNRIVSVIVLLNRFSFPIYLKWIIRFGSNFYLYPIMRIR